ncbi:MAG: DUF167 domain-containing protein [Deltaproteobacteria bacterium]|nr:DUF167 domain-containing protein [Deltaproteobacteria bacterium]
MAEKIQIRETPDGFSFKVRAVPRSSKNQVCGAQGEALKIKITAPPVEGAANQAICEFAAKLLDVAKSRVSVASGASSKDKTLFVEEPDPASRKALMEKIAGFAAG